MINPPENNFTGKEKVKKVKKKPTGILKDLQKLKRFCEVVEDERPLDYHYFERDKNGMWIQWSDVEKIINKYLNL